MSEKPEATPVRSCWNPGVGGWSCGLPLADEPARLQGHHGAPSSVAAVEGPDAG